jgi:hypothetical protein
MKNNLRAWGTVLAGFLPLLASAQAAKSEAPTAVPQLSYRSALADYKPYRDVPLANWREVNDIVAGAPGGASGHASHGLGAMKGVEAPATPAASASAPLQAKTMHTLHAHPQQGGKP